MSSEFAYVVTRRDARHMVVHYLVLNSDGSFLAEVRLTAASTLTDPQWAYLGVVNTVERYAPGRKVLWLSEPYPDWVATALIARQLEGAL